VSAYEDDGNIDICPGQFTLKIKAAYSTQQHVQHQALWPIRELIAQEVLCGLERLSSQASGFDQALNSLSHGGIIIGYKNREFNLWSLTK
jgi:hypothetical protein